MKCVVILGVIAPLIGAGGAPKMSPKQSKLTPNGREWENAKPLYLHLLAPPIFTNAPASTNPSAPAHRIVSTMIHISEEFRVAFGGSEDPFTNSWDGAWTNPIWDTNGVPHARPLEPVWNSGDAALAGRIDSVDGKLRARLQGRNRTTLAYYHGKIELEKPVYEHGGLYRNDAIWGVWFALSEDPNCGNFFKQLDNGTIKARLVEIGSPTHERWVKPASNAVPEKP